MSTLTRLTGAALITSFLALGACSNMNSTEQRTLSGAGIGAAGGAVIGAVVGGNPLAGAAIGGAAGAAGGYLLDQSKKGEPE
ncbi:MAG TPA: YMGG-like glycine zipper-containing protein [Aliidongia sp.]|uniref:YMGG-like glycine zipper-containing protein n=1 Tax=Aliidongia sp. TaxID=1914230 RepID=UPI002DDDA5C3|nr:YMGG-like glycine zipper-containing protein [Aliidongia sp.]HEV2673850.1 YMGG-like glycine zipper-containing protein [Aliidongia sp.]